MSKLTFTKLEEGYNRVYCPICVQTYITKIKPPDEVLCPECEGKEGFEQVLLYTIKGGANA